MAYDDIWRIISSRSFAVSSVGGAQASTAAFGSQTYAVRLYAPGTVSSTSGCRIAIGDGGAAVLVSSTQSLYLPANWPEIYKVSPGQTLAALSNDAGLFSLNVVELTK